MSLDHQLSDRVYHSLKKDVMGGILGCGRLNLASLEARYSSSATPVREGLLRLVGEGLVDLLPQGGFGVHSVDETELRWLYELNLRLLRLLATWRPKTDLKLSTDRDHPSSLSPPVDAFFLSLADTAENAAFTAIIATINDRLHCIRITENSVLGDTGEEYKALVRSISAADRQSLSRSIRAYHRRRIRFARAIANR